MSDKPSWIERWPWLRWKNRPITLEEILEIEKAWLNYAQENQYAYHKIEKRNDGVWVSLTPNSHLQIQPTRITFHGDASKDDAAIVASINHAREFWNNSFAVYGSDDFKMRSWAHAQVLGVRVSNYAPPEHMREQAFKLVEQIDAARAAEDRRKEARKSKTSTPLGHPSGAGDDGDDVGPRPLRENKKEEYVPPRNATNDFLANISPAAREAAYEILEEIRKKNPVGEWPYEPYHYGMGRDRDYDMWLASLSEKERKREIEASRKRYEAHYSREASALISEMRARGWPMRERADHNPDMEKDGPHRPSRWNGPEPDGPSLGGGRGR